MILTQSLAADRGRKNFLENQSLDKLSSTKLSALKIYTQEQLSMGLSRVCMYTMIITIITRITIIDEEVMNPRRNG